MVLFGCVGAQVLRVAATGPGLVLPPQEQPQSQTTTIAAPQSHPFELRSGRCATYNRRKPGIAIASAINLAVANRKGIAGIAIGRNQQGARAAAAPGEAQETARGAGANF
eukprot:14236960-Alexandrium_andersonii.AAC.1